MQTRASRRLLPVIQDGGGSHPFLLAPKRCQSRSRPLNKGSPPPLHPLPQISFHSRSFSSPKFPQRCSSVCGSCNSTSGNSREQHVSQALLYVVCCSFFSPRPLLPANCAHNGSVYFPTRRWCVRTRFEVRVLGLACSTPLVWMGGLPLTVHNRRFSRRARGVWRDAKRDDRLGRLLQTTSRVCEMSC